LRLLITEKDLNIEVESMEINLNDTVVLVTGSSRGIGKAIAEAMAEAGATVALHYNRSEGEAKKLERELGKNSVAFRADLENPLNAGKLFKEVVEEYEQVDLLVNNAGIFEPSPLNLRLDNFYQNWQRTIAVNLTSVGILCHEAVNHFMDRGGGRIINTASRAAFRGETEDYLAYAASKGGVVSLGRSIARSLGRYNIKSFTIAPGYVRTDMIDNASQMTEQAMMEEISLSRITEPEDIAPVTVLIAAGMMDHATGTTIDINGGSYMR
jgi:3-oxoacyl-[acyl-carrier protein] reductase